MNIELRKNMQKSGNAYGRDILVDGKYVATWRASSSREWTLYVNQFGVVRQDNDEYTRGTPRPFRAYAVDQLLPVFKMAFEKGKIPTEEVVKAEIAKREEQDKKFKIQGQENAAKERIRDHAEELLKALKFLVQVEEEYGDESNVAVNEAWLKAKTLIQNIEGRSSSHTE